MTFTIDYAKDHLTSLNSIEKTVVGSELSLKRPIGLSERTVRKKLRFIA
jgi:hypothetical protein